MRSEKARIYFVECQASTYLDNRLSNSLEALSLFQSDNLNLDRLISDISNVIDWNKVNHIKCTIESNKEPDNIQAIIDTHAWAKNTLHESLANGNIDKLVVSYLLGHYLFLDPITDFQWGIVSEKTNEKLKQLLTSIKVEILIPENASYSDKKYCNDYRNSVSSNSFKKMFDFMSAIERGPCYNPHFSNFISALANICYKINPNLITEVIESCEPILIRMIFNTLDPYQTNVILNSYNGKSLFPLLIGLLHIINPMWNNKYNESLETDWDFISDVSNIVKKISGRVKTDNLYLYITECSNIFGNRLWHSIFISFGIQAPVFLDSYINGIDFSHSFGAENVFETFCQFTENENILDDFSIKIYHRYLKYLLKERSYMDNFCGTNYLKFLIRAVYIESEKSHIKYGKKLNEVAVDFERALYSWDKKQITMRFTKLIVWVLGLAFFQNDIVANKIDMSYIINIFSNKKYLDVFNFSITNIAIDYGVLAGYLRNPQKHIIIKLPLSHDSYTCIELNSVSNEISPL